MKQDYTMAYLRHVSGLRPSMPAPASYRRVLPDGSTAPLTSEQGREIRAKVDALAARLRATS